MDIGLAAAMMARTNAGGDRRYEGTAMLSALPGAPTVRAPKRVPWSLVRREHRRR